VLILTAMLMPLHALWGQFQQRHELACPAGVITLPPSWRSAPLVADDTLYVGALLRNGAEQDVLVLALNAAGTALQGVRIALDGPSSVHALFEADGTRFLAASYSSNGSEMVALVAFNSGWNVLWARTFDPEDALYDVHAASDGEGGALLCCTTGESPDLTGRMLRFDSDGNMDLAFTMTGSAEAIARPGRGIMLVNNGFTALNATGTTLWKKTITADVPWISMRVLDTEGGYVLLTYHVNPGGDGHVLHRFNDTDQHDRTLTLSTPAWFGPQDLYMRDADALWFSGRYFFDCLMNGQVMMDGELDTEIIAPMASGMVIRSLPLPNGENLHLLGSASDPLIAHKAPSGSDLICTPPHASCAIQASAWPEPADWFGTVPADHLPFSPVLIEPGITVSFVAVGSSAICEGYAGMSEGQRAASMTYPVPGSDEVWIEMIGPRQRIMVIVNAVGTEVHRTLAQGERTRIPIASWAPGAYAVLTEDGSFVTRFVKE
jgi:hypothetical protein